MNISLIYVDEDYQAFGLRCISAILKEAGHRTRLILLKSKEMSYSREILEEIRKHVADSEIIGISCFSRASEKAMQILESIRQPGKICVWGGIHATLNPGDCAEYADVVCRGEGEGFMLDLAEKVGRGESWKGIANAAYKEDGRVVLKDLRPLIGNLDDLPMMDFSLDNEFHLKGNRLVQAHPTSYGAEPIYYNGTRGCDFHCTYCSNSRLKELSAGDARYVRKLGITKLIEHAVRLKQQFPRAKYFDFFDEDFCARKTAELQQFSTEYARQIGFPFECMVSPLRVSEEKLALLVKAGLWRINMGIESGSERTKKEIYNRHMSNEVVLRAARIINKHRHVVPYYFFIIGNPYEDRHDLTLTARHIADLPQPYFLRTYNLVFFPGTLLFQSARKDGIIGGVHDSGHQLDFVAGLHYKRHSWKRKNLYLNGLIYLMAGKIDRRRLGLVPRSWLKTLLRPGFVAFNEKNTACIRSLIFLKMHAFKLRGVGARLLKHLFNDPTSIYQFKHYVTSKMSRTGTAQ